MMSLVRESEESGPNPSNRSVLHPSPPLMTRDGTHTGIEELNKNEFRKSFWEAARESRLHDFCFRGIARGVRRSSMWRVNPMQILLQREPPDATMVNH